MHGKIRWNFLIGVAGAVLVLLISLPNNVWFTAMTRSLYAFVIFFLFTFVIRWWLGTIATEADSVEAGETSEDGVGSQIDLQTPDDADAMLPPRNPDREQAGEDEADDPFQPLNPPKLETKPDHTPEQMADALRRMSEE